MSAVFIDGSKHRALLCRAGQGECAERLETFGAVPRELFRDDDGASELAGELLESGRDIDRRADAGEIETSAPADVAVQDRADVQREPEAHALDAGDADRMP